MRLVMSKINWTVEQYDCVDSTLNILKQKASSGADEGLVVYAQEQTKGRGRHGNVWHGPRGNLYMSFLLRPNCTPAVSGQYSFLVAVALSQTIDVLIDDDHKKYLKWPNDVLVDGKKIAGILLESVLSAEGLVEELHIGVGVNILTPPDGAVAVKNITSENVNVDSFLKLFVKKISKLIDMYEEKSFSFVRDLWLKDACKLGKEIRVRLPNEIKYGVFQGLDDDGTLLLMLDNGTIERITAGEVYF